MKCCPRCKIDKNSLEFRKSSKTKDKLQKYCIECDKLYQKEWYQKNKEKCKNKSINRNKSSRELIRDYLLKYLENKRCLHCGESNIIVLEFDHLHSKEFNISTATNQSIEKVKEELTKCQILCANCHRIKTSKDRNDYKWRYSQAGKASDCKSDSVGSNPIISS